MTTIYLSSTYSDLKECREVVYDTLRKMRYDVIAMEDYVATDQRPLEKCLADVAACDLYIGLFAWRYGYIPPEGNPDHKSITELEYRRAIERDKHCLLFLLADDAPWSPLAMDVVSGEGDRGERIKDLRKELAQEKLVSFFKTEVELTSLVGSAVHFWERSRATSNATIPLGPAHKVHREKVEKETLLRSLFVDHTGFMSNRLGSFVGRVQELGEIRQHIAKLLPTGGYITITGQAGQGKSCIIAKLVEEYGPARTAHHFIPFNPGPDYQVSLLRDLMAQLILKYNLSDLYIASENRAALRDYFPKVLREVVEKGGQEIIFIDGLDQLKEDMDGERDLSFLPNNPPAATVFVLGTRPNDTLRPLELLKPHYAYPLPNLSRQDFDLLLERHKVKLDRVLADQFYKAMQENALYLDLVARELAQEGTTAPEDIIKRVADNPNNIFSLSLTRLKRQGVEWRSVLKPVLGVLLVAREPLSRRHIRQILEIDDERLGDGLALLGGLIANDGRQRYSLFHLKLQDYLRQDESKPLKEYIFAKDEEEGLHKKVVDWCGVDAATAIWQDAPKRDPTEQRRREYAREHYIAHLYYALEWQSLFALLDEGIYGRAKVHYDPSTRLYVQDLDLGRLAAAWEGWTLEEGVERLSNLCRYMLLRCSLASRADRYPLAAFRVLVLLKRRQDAVRLAELLTEPVRKTLALLAIAQQMRYKRELRSERAQILLRAHEVAYTIEESGQRVKVLKELCKCLVEVEQWERAEMAAREIVEWVENREVFDELGMALARSQRWEQAESMIRAEIVSSRRAKWLGELGGALAKVQDWQRARSIWAEVEALIRAISDNESRAKALSQFGKVLAEAGELVRARSIWAEVEALIRAISDNESRAKALSELGKVLAEAGELVRAKKAWEGAEVAIRKIVGSNRKGQVLIEYGKVLARAGDREQAKEILAWAETEIILRARRWGSHEKELLFDLCRTLMKVEEWERAEAAIDMMNGDEEQAKVLGELAVALAQAQQWERAETIIGKLKDSDKQAEAMSELAVALAQAQQMERAEMIWRRVEGIVHSEKQSDIREDILLELSSTFLQLQQWAQAATVIHVLRDKQRRTNELRKLATMLVKLEEWKQGEAIIRSIEEIESRADGLLELGLALIEFQEWKRAEAVIRSIEVRGTRAGALFQLIAALIKIQDLDKAETIINTLEEEAEKTKALLELITALLNRREWERAQNLIRTIKNFFQMIVAFGEMCNLLAQAQEWERAETSIRVFDEDLSEAKVMPELIKVLVQVKAEAEYTLSIALARAMEWGRAEAMVAKIADDEQKVRAFKELRAIALEAQEWDRAETYIRAIEAVASTEGWYALGIVLARAREWDRAEAIVAKIADDEQKVRAFKELRAIALEAQEWDRAETYIRAIEAVASTEGWYALGIALVRAREWDRAEAYIRAMQDDTSRIQALSVLAIALARAHQWERSQSVIDIIEEPWSRGEPLQELSWALIEAKEWKRVRDLIFISSEALLIPWDSRVIETSYRLVVALIEAREFEEAEEVIQMIKDPLQSSQMRYQLCVALIKDKQWEQAEITIFAIEEAGERVEALSNFVGALIEAKEWEQADIVLAKIRAEINAVERGRREKIFHELLMILIEAQQWQRAEAFIFVMEEAGERVEALSKLVIALAQAEEWQQEQVTWTKIEAIVDTIEDWQNKEQILSQLEGALMAARRMEHIEKIIYMLKSGGQRATALIELGVTLRQMQEWDRAKDIWMEAEAIIDSMGVSAEKTMVLHELAIALAATSEFEWLLRLAQRSWLRANTRDYAISLLPMANGLIFLKPEIGIAICEAFAWVDAFEKG